jgi:hypothetical protein
MQRLEFNEMHLVPGRHAWYYTDGKHWYYEDTLIEYRPIVHGY